MANYRKLSVHVEHELLLKLEAAGLRDELAQLVINSKDNKLGQEIVDLIGANVVLTRKVKMNLKDAANIVGKNNFFGPNQWLEHFGKKFSMPKTPQIPWSWEELIGLNKPHFLFLMPANIGGKPLDLVNWHESLLDTQHPRFNSEIGDSADWYLSNTFARKGSVLRWYLMPLTTDALTRECEVPTALARFTANILYYFLNGKYLDTSCWARTSDKTDHGSLISVRGTNNGIAIYKPYGVTRENFGIALSRKINS